MQKMNKESGEIKIISVAQRGDFFGELALFDENCRRTADVESITYSDLSTLSKTGLEEAFHDFPLQKQFFRLVANMRLANSKNVSMSEIVALAEEELGITSVSSND